MLSKLIGDIKEKEFVLIKIYIGILSILIILGLVKTVEIIWWMIK